jgi:hypothetical protein
MKTKILLLLLAFMVTIPNISNAQGYILRKALNKKIDAKIDSAVDKSEKDEYKKRQEAEKNQPDKAEGQDKNASKGTERGLFGGKIDIKHNDEYSFTGMIYSQMETYDNNEVRKSDYYTYFDPASSNAGMEIKLFDPKKDETSLPTQFIFDMNNRCFMVLIESESSKTGIISTIPDDSTIAAQAKSNRGKPVEQPSITKTGNTRMIAGFKCDEYKIVEQDKDGYSNVWMTKDLKIKADKRNWGKTGMPSYYGYAGFEGQTMLAMESFDKKNNPEMKMETKEINNNFPHKISTAGYTFMKMNFGQAGKK